MDSFFFLCSNVVKCNNLITTSPNEATYKKSLWCVPFYFFFTTVKKQKKRKPSEFGNVIGLGTALGHSPCSLCMQLGDV